MKRKKLRPLWQTALMDILLTGITLVVFAYFHHVRPTMLENENIEISRPTPVVTATPEPTSTPVPAATEASSEITDAHRNTPEPQVTAEPTPVPTPDPEGCFASRFADKFTDGEVISTEENDTYTYKSYNLNIEITKNSVQTASGTCVYYLTDFYVRDISCLASAFTKDGFSSGRYEWLKDISARSNAVVAVNGDFATMRQNGVVIRNGVLYRSKHSSLDACVIYWNGVMETFAPKDWDANTMVKNGAYQAWSFGPRLLDKDGNTMTTFNATDAVTERNPRTAIGYFEPGHYCFVTVDGRSNSSKGLTLKDLSELMHVLGCKAAYNLDGGQSTSLAWKSAIINEPYKDGRKIADAVLLVDEVVR